MADEERDNIIDRYEVKKEMYEAMNEVALKYTLTSLEIYGMIQEIGAGIIIDTTMQEWEREKTIQ